METTRWLVRVKVMLKPSILDAPGEAVKRALNSLVVPGISVTGTRMGKSIELTLEGPDDKAQIEKEVARLCDALLANMVIEQFTFNVAKAPKTKKPPKH